ncbi:MAG: ATP-binding protein [Desulfobacterales bacterium]|nr:ATP-binding protein [Desulfobacterales bacterium]
MSLILIVSIMIRLAAMGWSIVLLRRARDWRMGFLTMMLGLMALRQILTLLTQKESWAVSVSGHLTELPALLVGIMAFLAVFFLERIISEQKRAGRELRQRRDADIKLAVIARERAELQDWINTFDTFVGKFDPDGLGIIFNETPLKAGGLAGDEVVGKYFPDTPWWSHSEKERARVVECFVRARAGRSSRIETDFRGADGSPVPIIFNCQPVLGDRREVKYITAEGKIIFEEVRLRDALRKEKENLEGRVKERTAELVAVNKKLLGEINERKRAEQAIRESERFFSGVLNDMLTFVAVLEPDGRVIFVNNTALDAGGLTLDEVKGKMFHDAFWWQHSGQVRQQIKEDVRICATGETLVHDIEFQAVTGELVWIEYSMHPIYDENGKIKYLVPEGRDITGRKQAEEHIQHLQRVLMAIRDVNQLIVHEKNRKKLLQGACDILNQTRDYKLVWIGVVREDGMEVTPVAQSGSDQGYLDSIRITRNGSASGSGPTGMAIRTGKPAVMRDIVRDPAYRPWREEAIKRGYGSSAAIPLIHENKGHGVLNVYAHLADAFGAEEIDLLVEVGQDIAFALHNIEMEQERKQAVDDLRRAHEGLEAKVSERTRELARVNSELKEMDRLKSEFLATMSHELRTPLNSIIGFTGIILKGLAGEINQEQKKQLALVYGSANHLLNLINDILDLSRIESGKMEVLVTGFKIKEIVSEVTQTLSPMASQKGLQLVTEITDKIPEISSDRKKIFQILLNLANNAVKFTNNGEIRIDCTMAGHNLTVSVSDTGIGIEKEKMGCLFEAFRQVDGSAQRRYEGAGLGLHLCRKLVTLLGGTIWAASEYGKGSCFTFTLPVEFRQGGPDEKEDTDNRGQ